MTLLAQSPALRERLGQAGLSRARVEFDWERKIDRITDLYELAIKKDGQLRALREYQGPREKKLRLSDASETIGRTLVCR